MNVACHTTSLLLAGTMRGAARLEDQAVPDRGRSLADGRAGAVSVIRADMVARGDARDAATFDALGESGSRATTLRMTSHAYADVIAAKLI